MYENLITPEIIVRQVWDAIPEEVQEEWNSIPKEDNEQVKSWIEKKLKRGIIRVYEALNKQIEEKENIETIELVGIMQLQEEIVDGLGSIEIYLSRENEKH